MASDETLWTDSSKVELLSTGKLKMYVNTNKGEFKLTIKVRMQSYNSIGATTPIYVYSDPIEIETYLKLCHIVEISDPLPFPFK